MTLALLAAVVLMSTFSVRCAHDRHMPELGDRLTGFVLRRDRNASDFLAEQLGQKGKSMRWIGGWGPVTDRYAGDWTVEDVPPGGIVLRDARSGSSLSVPCGDLESYTFDGATWFSTSHGFGLGPPTPPWQLPVVVAPR